MDNQFPLNPGELDFVPAKYRPILEKFCESYFETALDKEWAIDVIHRYVALVKIQLKAPFTFSPHHIKMVRPIDYYQFGLDFLKPLVDLPHSTVNGVKELDRVTEQLNKGHNVIFFANHQIEADPQAISILLEESHPRLAEEMTFVAGERVLTDPLAVPFSMGRNLLCIYSKKYIDNPPEEKSRKQLHNKKTMKLMSALLSQGGLCVYVAPSGGRDRPNANGVVEVAPFDPQSLEMFYLMAKKADHPTHFYPLSLSTYSLLPPPDTLQIELGEERRTQAGAIHLACGKEFNMESFEGSDEPDRMLRRKNRAQALTNIVIEAYNQFPRSS